MQKITFFNYHEYHVYNRGALGMNIFKKVKDYLHFLLCMKYYNTVKNVDLRILLELRKQKKSGLAESKPEDALVEIIAYCLMPNHFHIILRPMKDGGIPLYMKKLGTGFAMYMNKYYKTTGHVFQGKYKCEDLESGERLLATATYIHINPIKKKGERVYDIKMNETMLKKISQYPWSSMFDYMNKNILIDPIEIQYVKPDINKSPITDVLGSQTYENYFLNFFNFTKVRPS